jgi:hypothetical protein
MIQGRQFLEVADALADSPDEAFVRTRIGRLYYGTWLEARSFCETRLGYSRQNLAREHQAVATMLGNIDAGLETELRDLRIARNQADYDDHLPAEHFNQLMLAVSVSSAWVLSRLDALKEGNTGE